MLSSLYSSICAISCGKGLGGAARTSGRRGSREPCLCREWPAGTPERAFPCARGAEHRLRCAVQLCTLRATGRFVPDYRRVPPEAVNHLVAQFGLDSVLALPGPERPATESAQLARIRRHRGWGEFDDAAECGCATGCRSARPRA